MNGKLTDYSTPNIPASEAVLILHSEIQIAAPAASVFRSLRNTETWRDWNRFVPRVTITHQPPEDDHVTAAEINEIVRNTSIIGSFDSDLTDGGAGSRRPRSPNEQPPPRFRLNSISSQASGMSGDQRAHSEAGFLGPRNSLLPHDKRLGIASGTSGAPRKSGAQLFQDAQESRRTSIASGEEPSHKMTGIPNPQSRRSSLASLSDSSDGGRRKSKSGMSSSTRAALASQQAAEKAHAQLMSVYGEPSVRLQIGTKMTFHVRMKAYSPSDFTETKFVVTEISRPDDPATEQGTTALTRSKTHTLDRQGHYRIVWATDSEGASIFHLSAVLSGSKMPKYLMQAERVHEIEPIDGESCLYRNWECQKGHAAKTVKKKYGEYLQKMSDIWAGGLKDFCEGLYAPKVARRDFSISVDQAPIVIQTLT